MTKFFIEGAAAVAKVPMRCMHAAEVLFLCCTFFHISLAAAAHPHGGVVATDRYATRWVRGPCDRAGLPAGT